MSNGLTIQEVEQILPLVERRTTELKVGDIVHTEFGFHLIGSIKKSGRAYNQRPAYEVLDHFESGTASEPDNTIHQIVDPKCLNIEGLRSVMEDRIASMAVEN